MPSNLSSPTSNSSDSVTADYQDNTSDLIGDTSAASEARWDWSDIDETNWSKSFPYQLVVLKAKTPPAGASSAQQPTSYGVYNGTVFTLPINPESMTKDMSFASSLQATLDGVVEQNGGVPFRDIMMSGTFGVLPSRPSGNDLNDDSNAFHQVQGIFGGTIQQGQQTIATATSVVSGVKYTLNTMGDDDLVENTTGYYQYRQFERFLETYAEAKKTDLGQSLRLALVIWKEQSAYLVTPRTFRVTRTKDSPFEYPFTLQLRAWKRINSASIGLSAVDNTPSTMDTARGAAWAQVVLQRLDLARKTLADASNTVRAISSDFDQTFGQALRQVGLFLKDAVGLAKTVVDFPSSIGNDLARDWANFSGVIQGLPETFKGRMVGSDGWEIDPRYTMAQDNKLPGGSNYLGDRANQAAALQLQQRVTEVKRDPSRALSAKDPVGLGALLADPKNDWLRTALNPDTLNLSSSTRANIQDEVNRVRALTPDDFRTMQQQAYSFTANYADKVGLGSATYNATLGLQTASQVRDVVDEDLNIIASLSDVAVQIGRVAAFGSSFQQRVPTTIEYVAGIANAAGISMRVPLSKFAVPFPYQGTLERLAEQYLGESQRWFEIAALNDLREPFVDEVGNTVPLLVQSKGNEFAIADASGLTLGQSVTLTSGDGLTTVLAVVLNATFVTSGYWVVQVDQPTNLVAVNYPSINYGQLQYFDCHTVHGGQVIYIPSDQPNQLTSSPYAPTQSDLQRMLQVGDVDGMLTESGDIAIQPTGDWPFVYGLQSIIQWARTAVSTPKGSMVLHPEWGFPVELGQIVSDTSASDILKGLQSMFNNGPAFVGVRSATVNVQPPVAAVSFELAVRGVDALIPVTFNIPK